MNSKSFSLPINTNTNYQRDVSLAAHQMLVTHRLLWVMIISHIILGVLLRDNYLFATLHALGSVLIGVLWAIAGKDSIRFVYITAYIVGAEVLWRMNNAQVFWEFGKYAVAGILILGITRTRSKILGAPIIYFVLLLPAVFITLETFDAAEARTQISFNLSGHLALVASTVFFFNQKVTKHQLQKMFIVMGAPAISIATIVLIEIVRAESIVWVNDSNFQTSGGFGPNQVSAALGLGALSFFLVLIIGNIKPSTGVILFALSFWLITQAALTFSRGGVYNAILPAICVLIFISVRRRQNLHVIPYIVVGGIILTVLIFPSIDDYTEGALSRRFEDRDTTHRTEIIEVSLNLFLENPVNGVGIGGIKNFTTNIMQATYASHTEYTRLIAEHGMLGILALGLLFYMAITNLFKAARYPTLGMVLIAVLVWSLFYMSHAAMRTVSPAFLFGLSFLTLSNVENENATFPHSSIERKLSTRLQ